MLLVVAVLLVVVGIARDAQAEQAGLWPTMLGTLVAFAASIVGFVAFGRLRRRLVTRRLGSRAIDVLGWAVPLVLAFVFVLGGYALSWLELPRDATMPRPTASVVVPGVLLIAAVLALVSAVAGMVVHRERARRRAGWMPPAESAAVAVQQQWQAAWAAAQGAVETLARRESPPTVAVHDVMLRPGERAFLDGGFEYARFYAQGVASMERSGLYFGPPAFVLAGVAGDAIANASRRAAAAAASAHQWREVQPVRVILTNERLLIRTIDRWLTFDHAMVVAFMPEPTGWYLVVDHEGTEPLRLAGMGAPHLSVLMGAILRGPEALTENPAFAPLRSGVAG